MVLLGLPLFTCKLGATGSLEREQQGPALALALCSGTQFELVTVFRRKRLGLPGLCWWSGEGPRDTAGGTGGDQKI